MSEIKFSVGRASSTQEVNEPTGVDKNIIVGFQQVLEVIAIFRGPFEAGLYLEHFIVERFFVITLNNVAKYLRLARDSIRHGNVLTLANQEDRLPFPVQSVVRSPRMTNNHSVLISLGVACHDDHKIEVLLAHCPG